MNKIFELTNIREFEVVNREIFLLKRSDIPLVGDVVLFNLYTKDFKVIYNKGVQIPSLRQDESEYIWLYTPEKFIQVNTDSYLKRNFEGVSLLKRIKDDGNYLALEHENHWFCCYNTKAGKISWTIKESSTLFEITDSRIFYVRFEKDLKKLKVICISSETGMELWSFDVSEIAKHRVFDEKEPRCGEAYRFLGVWKDCLYVEVTGARILALDVLTGEMRYIWENAKGNNIPYLPSYSNYLLKEEGKIVGVLGRSYWELNIETKEVKVEKLTTEFERHHLSAKRTSFFNDYVLFTSEVRTVQEQYYIQLAILNRRTLKVEWIYRFKEIAYKIFFGARVPTITNTHIYILDTTGTLHIFEKTT